MKQSLKLNLSQQLSLTPQLKQSLKLLQLSSTELEREIQTAINDNPLLERVNEPSFECAQSIESTNDFQNSTELDETRYALAETLANELSKHGEESNSNLTKLLDTPRASEATTRREFERPYADACDLESNQVDLIEHLKWQIQMTSMTARDKLIGNTLIHSLDEAAYLRVELAEVAKLLPLELSIELDEINAVLSLIKTLDPIGVGTRNLQDRLALLIDQASPDTLGLDLAKRIINEGFALLASRDLSGLIVRFSVSEPELAIALDLITQLNPHISSQFTKDIENYVIPDILIINDRGTWKAELNPDNQCRLRVNEEYANLLKSDIDDQSSEYIQANLTEAKIYIKSLMSRYDTLLLVAKAIVERQSAFFDAGELAMSPLNLSDIAQQLELHESTISRAISGKYLVANGTTYELKYFFSSALANKSGGTSSSTAIRSLIKVMVDSESKIKPLSDNKIAKKLEGKGHVVARRTVAKYRESMLIAPSNQRKELS